MNRPSAQPDTRRSAQLLLEAARDAAVRAPIAPPGGPPWPEGRSRPLGRLLLVVLAVLGIGLSGGVIAQLIVERGVPAAVSTVIGVALAAPLIIVGRWPMAAWRIMVSGLALTALALAGQDLAWPWPPSACIAMLVALFIVAATYPRQTVVGVWLVTAAAVLLAWPLAGAPLWVVLILWSAAALVLVFGDALRGRRSAEVRLAQQAALRRQDLAKTAVLEERGRIARELHDVVAHHMSMIAIQAEAAPHKIPDLPPAAVETLDLIRAAAREALAETRRVVGLLRQEGDDAERAPQPGLEQLDELVERARQSGLTVAPIVVGVPKPLVAGVDLSAYRIVQEALSNASRYAPGTTVNVEVRYADDRLRVAVIDDGAPAPLAGPGEETDSPGGHGLLGMRERVTMLGGTLSTGPRGEGGFAVVAELPYGEPA
jgi:signal transduction histidine kinase